MNYIELINRFWRIRRDSKVSAHEADFYYFLLNECNLREWQNPFSVSTSMICAELDIPRKTLINLRARLKEKGLIDYVEGQRSSCKPIYAIITKTPRKAKQQPIQQEAETEPLQQEAPPKQKKPKKPPKQLDELFTPPKPMPKPKKVFEPPTLSEVITYFSSQSQSEEEAARFFNHYESLGWKTATGAQVQRWDSRANSWILNNDFKTKTDGSKASRKDSNSDSYKQKLSDRAMQIERDWQAARGKSD